MTDSDFTIVLFGDRASMEMAHQRLQAKQTKQVWIIEAHIPRTVALKLAPRLGAVAKQELIKLGSPESRIAIQTTNVNTLHAAFRKLQEELPAEATITILCPHDRTRYMDMVLNASIDSAQREQWSLCSVPVYGYDEQNWWINREGWKRVSSAWLRQVHLSIFGEPPASQPWNPDEYEQTLAALK
jgi:hypothetical protein